MKPCRLSSVEWRSVFQAFEGLMEGVEDGPGEWRIALIGGASWEGLRQYRIGALAVNLACSSSASACSRNINKFWKSAFQGHCPPQATTRLQNSFS
jgi:hypothetical protein